MVAVTGMGAITCIGVKLDGIADSLRRGKSGIVLDEERRRRGYRSALTGRIRGFDPSELDISRKKQRTMCEPALYSYASARDALEDAGLEQGELESERCGVIFGNDSTVKAAVESIDIAREHGETYFIGGGHVFRSMNSTVSMNLSSIFGLRGASWTLSAACASGAHALGHAAMLIRSGLQDVVLTGGAQETNWQSMASFDALRAFSTREEAPQQASRPFDADRDGLVPSGGAACLVLEDTEHARARGARIYGFVRGYGFCCDGGHLTHPEETGALRCMEAALKDAGLKTDQIDYISSVRLF